MVFGVSLAGKALTLLMLVIRLEMFKWKPARVVVEQESRPKRRHVLSPGHVKVGTTLYPANILIITMKHFRTPSGHSSKEEVTTRGSTS